MDKEIAGYFDGKPGSASIFDAIVDAVGEHGTFDVEVKSQISMGCKRKFAWFWLYNVTKKNPDGVPHLMLAIDRAVESDHVRHAEQISSMRWNHQIVVSSVDAARSDWLSELIGLAYDHGSG